MINMINKTEVSNQITGLRPKVKQAAVFMAHHHTREIKKCEVRRGSKAKKFHNKAENMRKEIIFLRKVHPDTVSRYALLMDFEDREKLLSDVNLPLETKVIIKLATEKPVRSHIESFRATNPEWRSKLPHLLETLGIRARFKKKVSKEQEKQARKLLRRQELSRNSVASNCAQSGEDINEVSNINRQMAETVKSKSVKKKEEPSDNLENSDCHEMSEESDTEDNPVSDESFTDSNESEEEVCSTDNYSVDRHEIVSEEENGSSQIMAESRIEMNSDKQRSRRKSLAQKTICAPPISSGSLFAEVRRFADVPVGEETTKIMALLKSSPLEDNVKLVSHNQGECKEPVEEDTFFMTDGNNFLKTVSVKRENGEGLNSCGIRPEGAVGENASQWVHDGKRFKGNRAQRRAKFLGRDLSQVQSKVAKKADRSKGCQNSTNQRNEFTFSKQFSVQKDSRKRVQQSQEQLHQKSDHFVDQRSSGPKEKLRSLKKNVSNALQSKPGEILHPSWEAKRKQKVSLDSFQGKKIKFDDDL